MRLAITLPLLAFLAAIYWAAWLVEEISAWVMDQAEALGERLFRWSKQRPKGAPFPPNA
jgi:hypothetical protein